MQININELNGYSESGTKAGSIFKAGDTANTQSAQKAGFGSNSFCYKKEDGAFSLLKNDEEKDKTILDEAEAFDEKNSKNYMAVMSNTLSDEEYKALQEGGDSPSDYDPEKTVTLVDEIKVTLAKAGVHIAGYTDDLSETAVAEVCGNAANANAILDAMKETNLPATDDTIKGISREIDKATSLKGLSDSAKQYLLENNLEPTIDNLYKATYAGSKTGTQSGYYQAGNGGYYGKSGATEDLSAMEDQIQSVVEKAGLEVTEDSMSDAKWLLEKGLPLTEESLTNLETLNSISFPITKEAAAMAAADSIANGRTEKGANLTIGNGYTDSNAGYVAKAIEIDTQVKNITEDDVEKVVLTGKNVNLRALIDEMNQRLSATAQTSDENRAVTEATSDTATSKDGAAGGLTDATLTDAASKDLVAAKKQLVNIQLQMSAQANLKLLKQNIQIELEPLEKLSAMLDKEEAIYHSTAVSYVQQQVGEIKTMPAATLGISVKEAWAQYQSFNLEHVYETGKNLSAEYEKASQSYETLMTAPRADLGDRIQDAFRNVDDLLQNLNMDATPDNERAVRILGYNQMEITEENIWEVKQADATLQNVLNNLTPEKTLDMIREGVNPMTINLDELGNYLSDKKGSDADMEKYSKFLYKLEKNNEITAEEKQAYIGIYRLLRQVEKSDGAALGNVVANGQELNLENLLSSVRTRQKGYIDAKIDDGFGLLTDIQKQGTSISDQILGYYNQKAAGILDELGGTVVYDDDAANMDGYLEETLTELRDMNAVSDQMMDSLLSDGISLTPNNILAENALVSEGGLASKMADNSKKTNRDNTLLEKMASISEAFAEGKDAVTASMEDAAKEMEQVTENLASSSDNHIDVRSYAFDMRQISLMQEHAQNENYYVPLEINNQWTMLHVTFQSGETTGNVTIDYKGDGENLGKASVSFDMSNDHLGGLLVVDQEKDLEAYEEIGRKCSDLILKETGRTVDISCVQGQRTTSVTEKNNQQSDSENKVSNRQLYQIAKLFMETISESL